MYTVLTKGSNYKTKQQKFKKSSSIKLANNLQGLLILQISVLSLKGFILMS